MLVLLIEDDKVLAASLSDYLSLDGIECDFAYNGQTGLNLAMQNEYDVIVLDIMLPKLNGFTVCQQLRENGINTSILMMTARDSLNDKLQGFDSGTD
ncbi:response regulator, partial [Vibrio rotiferianus]